MIMVYHNDMSVCAAKVRTALAEKKLRWEGVHLDLRAGDAQKPEYLKLNPNAVVPTLVHDGRTIIESTVICEYIDDEWPDHPLKPDHTRSNASLDEATGRKRSRRSCGPFLMHCLSPSVAGAATARSGEMVGRHSASGSSRAIPIDDRAWIRLSVFCARIAAFREAF